MCVDNRPSIPPRNSDFHSNIRLNHRRTVNLDCSFACFLRVPSLASQTRQGSRRCEKVTCTLNNQKNNSLDKLNSILDMGDKRIRELKERSVEINLSNGENRLGKRRKQEGAAPRTTRSSPRKKGKRAESYLETDLWNTRQIWQRPYT